MGGSIVSELKITLVRKIKVPLPPLHVQEFIADILDKWTYLQEELARELARELECRKKQYHYYKELVLRSEANKWGYEAVEEIATQIRNGAEITKQQILSGGNFPALRCKDIYDFDICMEKCTVSVDENSIKHKKYAEFGDILVVGASVSKGTVGKSLVYLGERCLVGYEIAIVKHKQNPKYLAYALSTNYVRQQINKYARGAAIVNITLDNVGKIKIPLPPLEEQERIVSLLDPLYEMCGDAEKGIPALIAVIQKQYQYYKEELLRVQGNSS